MGFGIGIGIGWPNASAGISYAKKLIKAFKERVLSYPNSIFEAETCLDATLTELNAIGLLKEASLVITPNAYNTGILYDVVPNTTLGDMTVVRATTATRVNSAGLIEVVPRNLVTYSQDFLTGWATNAGPTITSNVSIAPNGTLTADNFLTSASASGVYQVPTVISGSTQTFSVYIKNISNATNIRIGCDLNPSTGFVDYNAVTNTIGSTGGAIISSSVENVGNGWFRVKGSYNSTGTSNTFIIFSISTSTFNYSVWGAQFENSTTATEYFPTTTRLNIPRIDYTNGSCPSLLVEPQRTNLLTYSNDYSDASWGKAGLTVTLGTQVNPQGIASTYSISNTTLGDSYLQKTGLPTTAGNYTMSVFVKNIDNVTSTQLMAVHLTQGSVTSEFTYTWATNTFVLSGTNAISGSSVLFANGWVRLNFTYSIGAGVTNHWNRLYANRDLAVTKSVLVYGFQHEIGSYATSYIPTLGASSVTRNADVISKTGISSLIGQTEGVLFVESAALFNDLTPRLFSLSNGTTTNRIFINYSATSNTIGLTVVSAGITILNINYLVSNTTQFAKIAVRYSNTLGYSLWVNGVNRGSNALVTIPASMSRLGFDNGAGGTFFFSKTKQVQLYKTALSDTEMATLTTL